MLAASMLSLLSLIAVSCLTMILTMKEGDLKTVRTVLVAKVLGLVALFWAPIVVFAYLSEI